MPEHGQEMQIALTHNKTTVVHRAMGICEDASKSSCPTYQPNILTCDQAGWPALGGLPNVATTHQTIGLVLDGMCQRAEAPG